VTGKDSEERTEEKLKDTAAVGHSGSGAGLRIGVIVEVRPF
jgi:hypothetical protein